MMENKHQNKLIPTLMVLGLGMFSLASCSDDDPTAEPAKESLKRSELVFTELGKEAEPHGNHFHGLADAEEGKVTTVKFNDKGEATENGHLHLEAEAVYKLELKTWDDNGKEVQNDFLADSATASNYKAFLIGGNFILNQNTEEETGAIFQPREQQFGDGKQVTGAGGIGTTGILSYFTVGEDNEGATKKVRYVLRKLNTGVKATITRDDWNAADYKTKFAGEDVLELAFEIHAEEHGH